MHELMTELEKNIAERFKQAAADRLACFQQNKAFKSEITQDLTVLKKLADSYEACKKIYEKHDEFIKTMEAEYRKRQRQIDEELEASLMKLYLKYQRAIRDRHDNSLIEVNFPQEGFEDL